MGPPPDTFRDRWIGWVLRHHLAVLVTAVVLTLAAGLLAARLRIDTDLRLLLPQDHDVVRALDEVESRFGGIGSVNVVVRGGAGPDRRAFAEALARDLRGHELLSSVDERLPSDFFVEHALYYLQDSEMEELQDKVEAWTHYEMCTAEPDLCTLAPDPKARDRLREFVQRKREAAVTKTGFREFYERDGIDALVVLLHPIRPSSDLAFTSDLVPRMRAAVEATFSAEGAPWIASGVTYNLVGPYVVKAEARSTIGRDMVRSGVVGLVGVVLIVYLLFRSMRAVLLLLIPLACGVTWSMGVTQLALGHLNSMTSLISSVVMGLGIDAGIHFLSRTRHFRREHSTEDAIRLAFSGLLAPLLVASSTTMGAFAVMATSRFPAFREFGIIASSGVALCLLSMVTVFPALARLLGVKEVPPRRARPMAWLTHVLVVAKPGLVFAAVVAVTLVSFHGIRAVEFEYDGRRLQSDQARASTEDDTRLISQIFGKDIHAGIVVVDTLEEARAVLQNARSRHALRRSTGESVVVDFFGAPDLLPPAEVDPGGRREAITSLREDIPDSAWARLERGTGSAEAGKEGLSKEDARLLRRMLDSPPVGLEDLPEQVRAKVQATSGAFGIFAYPAFDAANMRKGAAFMEETSSYLDNRGVFVGETTVYAAMFLLLHQEAPVVLGMASVLIAALVFWQLRSLSATVLTLLPLGVGMWWLFGFMGAFDLRLTLFNIPILPAILGIGVDNGVYLVDRMRRVWAGDGSSWASAIEETGAAILAATATTAVGFAAFLVADSGGLQTIGALGFWGIVIAALAALIVLPTLVALGRRSRWRRARRRRARAKRIAAITPFRR